MGSFYSPFKQRALDLPNIYDHEVSPGWFCWSSFQPVNELRGRDILDVQVGTHSFPEKIVL